VPATARPIPRRAPQPASPVTPLAAPPSTLALAAFLATLALAAFLATLALAAFLATLALAAFLATLPLAASPFTPSHQPLASFLPLWPRHHASPATSQPARWSIEPVITGSMEHRAG
jgi:hypothetical protein